MAIKELDQASVNSIYNKFIFTAKPQVEVLEKKSVVAVSNNLTSVQNAFNVLSASMSNISKLTQYKSKRQAQIANEKTIEGLGAQRVASEGAVSADFSSTLNGFRILANYFEEINNKLNELDLSSSCDVIGGEAEVGGEDIDIDRKKRRSRGRLPRTRGPRVGGRGLSIGGKLFGVLGVGLDVADRVSEGQSLTQTVLGVGGGLAGGLGGAKLGATLGSFAGPVGTVAGGLIGGVGGYLLGGSLADKGYEAVTKAELPSGSYSERFAKFLQGSITNVVSAVSMLSPVTAGIIALGKTAYDAAFGDEDLPANAGALDAIAKAEGTYGPNGYNTSLANGAYLPGGKEQKLTDKSLDEILQLQKYMLKNPANKFNSSALGRYQIVSTTLRAAAKGLNLDTKTTKFSPEIQDKMAMWIIKKQGFGAWEGFKRNPEALKVAQKALEEGRYTTPAEVVAPGGMVELGGDASHIELTSGTGKRDVIKKGEDHPGLDLVHKKRTPNTLIASATKGKVVYAGTGVSGTGYGGLGEVVSIKTGDKYYVYAHLVEGSIGVKKGDDVDPGTVLGIMGTSGISTGVHLHFEIRAGKGAPGWGSQIKDNGVLMKFVQDHPWIIGGKKTKSPGQKFDPKSYTKPTGDLLLDPRKKKPVKTVVVPQVVYVPVGQGKGGPGSSPPQSPRSDSTKKLPYYIGY